MSDRIVIMHDGKMMQVGTPSEIYENPANDFVADFIGETNFMNGKVLEIEENKLSVLTADGLTIHSELNYNNIYNLKPNDKVSVCIRPERVVISKSRPSGDNVINGVIESVLYMGSNIKYILRLNDDFIFTINEQLFDTSNLFKEGEKVYIKINPNNCLVIPIT